MKKEEFYIKGCISASKFMEDRDFKLPKDSFIVNEKYDCFEKFAI